MDNGQYILNKVKKKNVLKHNFNNNIVANWLRKYFLGKKYASFAPQLNV